VNHQAAHLAETVKAKSGILCNLPIFDVRENEFIEIPPEEPKFISRSWKTNFDILENSYVAIFDECSVDEWTMAQISANHPRLNWIEKFCVFKFDNIVNRLPGRMNFSSRKDNDNAFPRIGVHGMAMLFSHIFSSIASFSTLRGIHFFAASGNDIRLERLYKRMLTRIEFPGYTAGELEADNGSAYFTLAREQWQ
jgi:hypothetical protein